jgi:hypothetical protein
MLNLNPHTSADFDPHTCMMPKIELHKAAPLLLTVRHCPASFVSAIKVQILFKISLNSTTVYLLWIFRWKVLGVSTAAQRTNDNWIASRIAWEHGIHTRPSQLQFSDSSLPSDAMRIQTYLRFERNAKTQKSICSSGQFILSLPKHPSIQYHLYNIISYHNSR